MRSYWCVRLNGGKYAPHARKGKYVAIGWNEIGNLGNIDYTADEIEIKNLIKWRLRNAFSSMGDNSVNVNSGQIYRFFDGIKIDDIVVSPFKDYFMIGVVTSRYYWENSEDGCNYNHRRKVKWITVFNKTHASYALRRSFFSPLTIFNVNKHGEEITSLINNYIINEYLELQDSIQTSLGEKQHFTEFNKSISEGNFIFYIGGKISNYSNLPTMNIIIKDIINTYGDSDLSNEVKNSLLDEDLLFEDGAYVDILLEEIIESYGIDKITQHFRRSYSTENIITNKIHESLYKIKPVGIITPNYDSLLEKTFNEYDNVYTPKDIDKILNSIQNEDFFIFKNRGSLKDSSTLLLTNIQNSDYIFKNREYEEVLTNLLLSYSIIFIGCTLEEIRTFYESIRFRNYQNPHYAFIQSHGIDRLTTKDVLERRYGVKITTINENRYYDFIVDLITDSAYLRRFIDPKIAKTTIIESVSLTNIGPFDNIDINFEEKWNVLLGDNGVGKSTILKAIAMCLCGVDAEKYGSRLLKHNAPHGKIVITTKDGKEYRTEISKARYNYDVTNFPLRPLELERRLTIAFPPIRIMTWDRPDGPSLSVPVREATPDDLIPILNGEIDNRINNLKQWIINLDYARKSNEPNDISNIIFNKFIKIIQEITGDVFIYNIFLNSELYEILVETRDGVLPIESLSQGSISLLGWVGVLVKRFFEVYNNPDALDQHAIILIDEIDAHMHPKWQQSIISKLQIIFPNAQFIASTHSPLVISSLPENNIFHIDRNDEGEILVRKLDKSILGWRTDQILTSPIFGLQSTRDISTQKILSEYSNLRIRKKRSSIEETRFIELQRLIGNRIPRSAEREEMRQLSIKTEQENLQKWESRSQAERNEFIEKVRKEMKRKEKEGSKK